MVNLSKMEKRVLAFEGLFLVGAFVLLFVLMTPGAVSPIAGQVVSDPDFTFQIENGESILISRDGSFENPIKLEEGGEILLPPGKYYWKVKGMLRESEVQTFTIESNVGLNLREGENKDILENSGNVDIEVRGGLTGSIGFGESSEVEKKNETYEGSQDV